MKTIFLDLEQTIFQSVDNPELLTNQIEKIKSFISKDDKIVLFSFALWEESDLTNVIKNIVSELFGEFSVIFKNDLKPLFKKNFGINDDLDFMDFSSNKQTTFLLFIFDQITNGMIKTDCIFFDDMISTIDMNICGKSVEFKNVKEL